VTTAETPDRQLLIGVDAMEWTLLKKWMAEGKLPNLQKFVDEGMRAELQSLGDCVPDAVWTTFSYGVNPGKLQKYFYVQYDYKLGRLRYAHDHELTGKQFWQYLSEAGKRVGVADMPHLPPHEIPNGFLLMNWGAHDNKHHLVAYPPPLLEKVKQEFGRHPMEDCERYNKDLASTRRLRDDILLGVRKHGEMFRWLMQAQPWDVFVCCFAAAHSSGHHFWAHMDPTHPDYQPGDPLGFENTMERTYQAIDREIGEMVEAAGERTRVLVFAPHGMGQLSHASWNLNEMLELWGFATGKPSQARPAERRGKVNPWRILKMVFPARWQYAIKESLPRSWQDQLLFLWYAGRSQYKGLRAFAVPNNEVVGAIRISVKGRDREGLVEPGADYRKLRDQIREALLELTDPATGRRVVRDVIYLHERFHGPYVEQLPDIAVFWDSTYHWEAVASPRFGTLRIRAQDRRSGSHSASSFVLARGPGIPQGVEVNGCTALDIPAWVLDTAGVAVPPDLDGKPIVVPQGIAGRSEGSNPQRAAGSKAQRR
jgi:predicted AlkP superfamily phosphohydrolase/phosphomutase